MGKTKNVHLKSTFFKPSVRSFLQKKMVKGMCLTFHVCERQRSHRVESGRGLIVFCDITRG